MRAHANDRKARKTKRDGGDTGVKEEVEEGASRRKRHTVTNDVLRMFLQAWRDGKTSFVLPVFHTNAAMMYWYANADEPVALADLADLGDQDQGAAYLLLLLPWRRDGDVDVVQVYQAYDVDGQTIVDTENHKLYVRRSDAPCFQPPGTQCVYVLPGHFTKVPRLPRLVVINRWTSKPAVGTALSDDGSVVVLQHGIISHNSHMQMLFQRLLGDRLRGHDRTPIRLRFVWHTSLWRRADQDSAILEPDLEPDAEPGIEEEEAILSASLFSEEGHAVLADAALRSSALRNLRLESPLTHSFSTLDLGVLQLLGDAANSKCGVEVAIAMHGTIELDVDVIKAPYGMCVEMLRFAIPGCVAYARYRNAIYRYNYHALHAQTGKYGMPDLVFADQLSIRSGGTTSAEDGKFDRATARQTRPGEHCGLVVCSPDQLFFNKLYTRSDDDDGLYVLGVPVLRDVNLLPAMFKVLGLSLSRWPRIPVYRQDVFRFLSVLGARTVTLHDMSCSTTDEDDDVAEASYLRLHEHVLGGRARGGRRKRARLSTVRAERTCVQAPTAVFTC